MSKNYALGKILCKGSGLKAYFEIKLSRPINGNPLDLEYKTFRYEVGNLVSILAEVNRQSSWNYVAGRSTAVGINKGLRNSFGTIVFSQLDVGMLFSMFTDVKKWNQETKHLEEASLDGFSFNDWTLADPYSSLLGSAEEDLNITLHKSEVLHLDDLPILDVVVVGSADQIDDITNKYEVNNTYIFKAKGVSFVSDTFGISSGTPLHNVATKCLILEGIEPWKKVE